MKYGYRCHSTMCEITFYIIEDDREICLQRFQDFLDFLQGDTDAWEEYCSTTQVYCSEDSGYSFTVGKLDDGNYVLVTDLGCSYEEDNKAIEFQLLDTYTDRF